MLRLAKRSYVPWLWLWKLRVPPWIDSMNSNSNSDKNQNDLCEQNENWEKKKKKENPICIYAEELKGKSPLAEITLVDRILFFLETSFPGKFHCEWFSARRLALQCDYITNWFVAEELGLQRGQYICKISKKHIQWNNALTRVTDGSLHISLSLYSRFTISSLWPKNLLKVY